MDYNGFINTIANLLVVPVNDPNYQQILPAVINDVEMRVYREIDLLSTIVRDTSGTLTANSRNFTFPQTSGRFVVSESMNVFTPSGTTTNRNQLVPVTREWMDAIWGNEAATTSPSVPQYYAMINDQTIIVGPPPDANYTMEVVGTIRPTPLSAANPTTVISLYLPDLLIAGAMPFAIGYLKDYGAGVDDPQALSSWELHFQRLLPSANVEEMRKRYASQAWSPKSPAPLATPARA